MASTSIILEHNLSHHYDRNSNSLQAKGSQNKLVLSNTPKTPKTPNTPASSLAIQILPEEHKPRMVINKMVLNNFKSYFGKQEIGPFHKVWYFLKIFCDTLFPFSNNIYI